jgi:hypothetical protein
LPTLSGEADWNLTAEERTAITELSRDLPAIWHADTTTNQERKQLLRLAIESVQVDGSNQLRQVEVQIPWRSGTVTSVSVKRAAPGECSLKTPEEAVSRIHKMAPRRTYEEIASALNRAGLRSAFGRPFTKQHVGYICRRDGLNRRSDTGAALSLRSMQTLMFELARRAHITRLPVSAHTMRHTFALGYLSKTPANWSNSQRCSDTTRSTPRPFMRCLPRKTGRRCGTQRLQQQSPLRNPSLKSLLNDPPVSVPGCEVSSCGA